MNWINILNICEWDLLRLSIIGLCITISISAGETIYLAEKLYGNSGLLNWEILKMNSNRTNHGFISSFLNTLFLEKNYRTLQFGIITTAILAITLAAINVNDSIIWIIIFLILFLNQILIYTRSGYGIDGSDQLKVIITFSILGYFCFFNIGPIRYLFLGFTTINLFLSYFVAGFAKLISIAWLNGSAIKGIASTSIFGNKMIFKFVKDSIILQKMISYSTIIFEVGIIFIFLDPIPLTLFYMILGILFHITVALTMGLNSFVFTFTSAYPLVLILLKFLMV
jgi:hypothetical protein